MSIAESYLKLLTQLDEIKGGSFYGMEGFRTELHNELLLHHRYVLEDCYVRSKQIFEHLDIAIGFTLPLETFDSIIPYARELNRLLSCTECKYFLDGKGILLRTNYGTIHEKTTSVIET